MAMVMVLWMMTTPTIMHKTSMTMTTHKLYETRIPKNNCDFCDLSLILFAQHEIRVVSGVRD